MYGDNPIRPPVFGNGSTLMVQKIFPTIQGEGPFVGMPSVFIRLGGCNLACNFCDTEFESFCEMLLDEIISEINAKCGTSKLVVITGGEPLRQPIESLTERLLALGFTVQIETNGTLYRKLPKGVNIICSPKAGKNGYHPIRPDLLKSISAFKFIISKNIAEYSFVPNLGLDRHETPIFVQPMDEHDKIKNLENRNYAMDLAMKNGYRLSIQLHKILDIE